MPEREMVQLESKQCMSSELTSRFENIEMYKIDYSLDWEVVKMETNYPAITLYVSSTNMSCF